LIRDGHPFRGKWKGTCCGVTTTRGSLCHPEHSEGSIYKRFFGLCPQNDRLKTITIHIVRVLAVV